MTGKEKEISGLLFEHKLMRRVVGFCVSCLASAVVVAVSIGQLTEQGYAVSIAIYWRVGCSFCGLGFGCDPGDEQLTSKSNVRFWWDATTPCRSGYIDRLMEGKGEPGTDGTDTRWTSWLWASTTPYSHWRPDLRLNLNTYFKEEFSNSERGLRVYLY